jgi:hypothetical protein
MGLLVPQDIQDIADLQVPLVAQAPLGIQDIQGIQVIQVS